MSAVEGFEFSSTLFLNLNSHRSVLSLQLVFTTSKTKQNAAACEDDSHVVSISNKYTSECHIRMLESSVEPQLSLDQTLFFVFQEDLGTRLPVRIVEIVEVVSGHSL